MILLRMSALLFSIVTLVTLGCHSTQLKSPSDKLLPSAENPWLTDYKSARAQAGVDNKKACDTFSALGRESQFPAHDLARLRALEICADAPLPKPELLLLPDYLVDLSTDILLKLAGVRSDKTLELEMALEKSKQKLPQNEKIKWVQLAIQRADELKLTDRVTELQRRLYTIAPRLDPAPEEKNLLSVAQDLRLARQFKPALALYEKIIASEAFDTDSKIAAFKGIRLSFKNSRQNDSHIQTSQRLIAFLKTRIKAEPNLRKLVTMTYDAELYLARALWTMGDVAAAEKIFFRLEKTMKGKVSLGELYWLHGRLSEDKKQDDAVSHYLELATKERISDPDLRDKILWYSAWNERQRKNLPKSSEFLQALEGKTVSDFTRARALYWLGRTQQELQQRDEGEKTLARLIEQDPLGYYGLLARRQLGSKIQLQSTVTGGSSSTNVQIPLDLTVADWLVALEEKEALTALLDQTSQAYKRQKDQTDEGWVRIFQYYARAGLYMKLYESLATLTPDQRKSIFERHPDLLFPQPWNDEATAAATQFGIDSELIYSIIRQESAFDPHARSPADAFGLMQLLPEVGESLGAKYKIPYKVMEDLYDPKTNIYLGAAHLKELFARHKGQFILSVAAYNASESVIRNWMKSRFHGDATEFIEDIPYEETRSYVRLVMRNYIFYNLLKSPTRTIEFPSWLLKLEN